MEPYLRKMKKSKYRSSHSILRPLAMESKPIPWSLISKLSRSSTTKRVPHTIVFLKMHQALVVKTQPSFSKISMTQMRFPNLVPPTSIAWTQVKMEDSKRTSLAPRTSLWAELVPSKSPCIKSTKSHTRLLKLVASMLTTWVNPSHQQDLKAKTRLLIFNLMQTDNLCSITPTRPSLKTSTSTWTLKMLVVRINSTCLEVKTPWFVQIFAQTGLSELVKPPIQLLQRLAQVGPMTCTALGNQSTTQCMICRSKHLKIQ